MDTLPQCHILYVDKGQLPPHKPSKGKLYTGVYSVHVTWVAHVLAVGTVGLLCLQYSVQCGLSLVHSVVRL